MRFLSCLGLVLLLAACGPEESTTADDTAESITQPPEDPYPSTYKPYPSSKTLITGATVLIGDGTRIENGAVLFDAGRLTFVGAADQAEAGEGATVIEAAGKFVTPGIIDIHSHLGVYPSPANASTADGNEIGSPNTAEVWAEHSVWPQDPGFSRALAGGVTTLQILPGSANLFGGRTVTVKNVSARTVQGMKFPGAPYGLKMACGENPKRIYRDKGLFTRMGNFAGYREGWIQAAAYKKEWDDYLEEAADVEDGEDPPDAPDRDLELETLAGVLSGDILLNMHCYRADEMAQIIDLSREFDFDVISFHHAVEAYKLADTLAEEGICAAIWADWWGFKLEAYDSIRENAALVHAQEGGCAIIHSDSPYGVQRLNQEAAKAMADGNRIGLQITEADAMAWITLNPAKAMGIADETGSLTVGKAADVVIWNRTPFSVYAQAESVFVDGALLFDRSDPARRPVSDFELGQDVTGEADE